MEALSLLINIQSFTSGVFKTSGGAETTPLIDHTVPAEVLHTKDKKITRIGKHSSNLKREVMMKHCCTL